jgi:DNA-binding NtrC family response regulator
MKKPLRVPPEGYKILLVDDDPDFHQVVSQLLAPAHRLLHANDAEGAWQSIESKEPDLVLLDLRLGHGPDGFQILERLRSLALGLPVIIVSENYKTDTIVRAMKAGAAHFISKPLHLEELLERMRLVMEERLRKLQIESYRLPESRLIASGAAMEEVLELVRLAATTDFPVLLLGETGSGKTLFARQIHRLSARREGPFHEVNVAALLPTVLDSELFGHEKGSFTGAEHLHRGLFEVAAGGTILLDEIGDLTRECQVKLLQVVESGRFRRVGGEAELHTSARILGATHRDLGAMIEQETFRRDLYYRLAKLTIWIPPLRERWESIVPLARSFLKDQFELTSAAEELLLQQRWPGNIRQLQHTLGAASLFAANGVLDVGPLERAIRQSSWIERRENERDLFELPYADAVEKSREDFQREYFGRLLLRHHGNISQAARESGLARPSLHALLKRLGLQRLGRPERRDPD